MTIGTAATAVAMRTQRFAHSPAMRIRICTSRDLPPRISGPEPPATSPPEPPAPGPPQPRLPRPSEPPAPSPESPCGSDGDNPVAPEIERELLVQTIDKHRAVLVQKRDEADRPLLRVAAGEGERSRVHELPPQRFVAPLRGLNHLAVQRLQVALHPLERRSRRAFERGIERRDRLNQARHLRLDGPRRARKRILDHLRNL